MNGFGLYRAAVKLLVNGSAQEVPEGTTISKLLEILGARSEEVAVEVNTVVVRRAQHGAAALSAGDQVEVVTFVGGG
jgi:sulfur carrier protein